ncbi:NAD kinase [hydrothermal vent metagenome]|uniref:NAD kinase n=1 Tax=hydrothermal vent metagenome TaxID=652676 RepID=A0A3B1AT96_9ZZZZ
MKNEFNKIGLIGKYGDPSVEVTLLSLYHFLIKRGCEVVIDKETASTLKDQTVITATLDEIGNSSDLVITVGGDGTLLNAVRNLIEHKCPILGINLGRLGFLVDVSPYEMTERMDEILDGKFEEEHRIMLTARVEHADGSFTESDAFNDVVVHKWEMARMIETETYINGCWLNTMRSDGLIVSTPTGSTAYALSGGGPILEPDMDAMILVPICPHSMSYRPIVIDGDSEIEIVVRESVNTKVQISCDGQINLPIKNGDKIHIFKKKAIVRIIHPCKHDYFEILRAKLHWGENL